MDDMELSDGGVPYEQLRPTLAHDVVAHLINNGLARRVVSQVPVDPIAIDRDNAFFCVVDDLARKPAKTQVLCVFSWRKTQQ